MSFRERYAITGTLTTMTPLHVGCGGTTTRPGLTYREGENEGQPVLVSAVALDCDGRPYLPGSTIKGRLRAGLRSAIPQAALEALFGTADQEDDSAVAGRVECWDARFKAGPEEEVKKKVPYWHEGRRTGVAAAVAIQRRTRTAAENKLMHREYVPPGVAFAVEITAQGLDDDQVALLLFALEQAGRAGLGADTGDGWGQLDWRLGEVRRMRAADLTRWLAQEEPPVGYAALAPLSEDEVAALRKKAGRHQTPAPPRLSLTLRISFEGPFLVNDPSQTRGDDDPDHAPLRDHEGRLLLPARSLRGALRSQAERIVRTLRPEASCLSTGDTACVAIYDVRDLGRLCLTCQLFGAPGWRAPLSISDFTPDPAVAGSGGTRLRQEFLAIDRFTGGGAEGLKFDAESVYRPVLSGTVDLAHPEPWMRGLLCLILRDLAEGDVPLGFGAAKGYGACRAEFSWDALGSAQERGASIRALREKIKHWQPPQGGDHAVP